MTAERVDPLVCCTDPDQFTADVISGLPGGHHLCNRWRTDPATLVVILIPYERNPVWAAVDRSFVCQKDSYSAVTIMPLTAAQITQEHCNGEVFEVTDPWLARPSVQRQLLEELDMMSAATYGVSRICDVLARIRSRTSHVAEPDLSLVVDTVMAMIVPGHPTGDDEESLWGWLDIEHDGPTLDEVIDTAVAAVVG